MKHNIYYETLFPVASPFVIPAKPVPSTVEGAGIHHQAILIVADNRPEAADAFATSELLPCGMCLPYGMRRMLSHRGRLLSNWGRVKKSALRIFSWVRENLS